MRRFLAGKIHRIRVTATEVNYVGSIGVPISLLKAAGINPLEEVEVWNVTNGERFATYAVPAEEGLCTVFGAAARRVATGDFLIVSGWTYLEFQHVQDHKAKLAMVSETNRLEKLIIRGTSYLEIW
jgi:aspartate 1-decarboxylase